ncbi:MAG: hypothetical protein LIO95_11760, partial [Clostridiales bacterium]|nr:hypothetical protein [Clostridiales bacterium]
YFFRQAHFGLDFLFAGFRFFEISYIRRGKGPDCHKKFGAAQIFLEQAKKAPGSAGGMLLSTYAKKSLPCMIQRRSGWFHVIAHCKLLIAN